MAMAPSVTLATPSGAGFSEDGRPEAGMSADAADHPQQQSAWIFSSAISISNSNRLYTNNGDGTFIDGTIASGIGQSNILNSSFGARFFDFDNDGWRDLLVINGHILDNIAPLPSRSEIRRIEKSSIATPAAAVSSTQAPPSPRRFSRRRSAAASPSAITITTAGLGFSRQ